MPQEAALHPTPVTVHFTAVFEFPVTRAENCCWPRWAMVATVGAIVTAMLGAVPIVTLALPVCVTSDRDVATTSTIGGVGAEAGAV